MDRKYVEKVLLRMGIPANVKGFRYITDAVMLLDEDAWKEPKYTALYYQIGKMNGSTASGTERAIRHAFGIARSSRGEYEVVEHYIGFVHCENSSSIARLYRVICQELREQEKKEDRQQNEQFFKVTWEQLVQIITQAVVSVVLSNPK